MDDEKEIKEKVTIEVRELEKLEPTATWDDGGGGGWGRGKGPL
jgi:hypothetical protein